MKGCKETITLKAGEAKALAVKVEFKKNNKVIIRAPYNQELSEIIFWG